MIDDDAELAGEGADAALEREMAALFGDAEPFVGPLSPQQLADLDRALTPAEQADVDRWQAAQAQAQQAAEEAKPFINPQTGKLTKVTATYETTPTPEPESWPWWKIALAALGVVAVGGTGYYLATRRPTKRRAPAKLAAAAGAR